MEALGLHLKNCLKERMYFTTSEYSNLTYPIITPAVVPKRHTLFGIKFVNNCAWLNMCCAVLTVEHFEGQGV